MREVEIFPNLIVREDGKFKRTDLHKNNKSSNWNNGCEHLKYFKVSFKNKTYLVHRLIALAFIPNTSKGNMIDHIDGNGLNNNISNLRWVTNRENQQNKSYHRNGKLPGVSYDKSRNKWVASAQINKVSKNLGRFKTQQEAHQAYLNAVGELK